MNSKSIQVIVPRRLGLPLCSLLLTLGGGSAQAHDADRLNARLEAFQARSERHAARLESREIRQTARQGISAAAPGERLIPAPTIDVSRMTNHAMAGRNSRIDLPGQVSAFRISRPETSNRSTFINDAGHSRALRAGVSLDLSSTDANISIGERLLGDSTVTITVGGQTKEIKAGSQVTAAEYAALNQQLVTGTQDLKLNDNGAAIDGSLNLNVVSDNGKTINTSGFVIPESVEVTGDFGRHADGVRVTNDLVNYGSLFAVSTKANKNTAVIGARDIINHDGAVITSNAPLAVTSQTEKTNSNLDLILRASRDLNNAGEISSSGDLELSAGNSLTNSGSASARGNVQLNASNVGNTGNVSAQNGNISILASADSNLNINSAGGTFSAINGSINIATTPDTNIKNDTTIEGGKFFAKEMNVSSGDGRFGSNFEDVTARVNVNAGIVSLKSNGEKLITGDINATGDPLIQNATDVVLSGNIDSNGGPISIVAGRNISVGSAFDHISSTSMNGSSGDIFMAAGVNFNIAGGVLTITGASATGGSINLTDLSRLTSGDDASNTTVAATINMNAFEGSAPNSGRVTMPGSTTLRGTTTNGTLNVNAAATSGVAINFGTIDSNGTGNGGIITMYASAPSMGSPIQIAATGPNEGQVTGGYGPVAPSVGTSNIVLGDVSAAGGAFPTMNLNAMGDITVNSFTSGSSGSGAYIQANSVIGDVEMTGAVHVVSSGNYLGGVSLTASAGTVKVGSMNFVGGSLSTGIFEAFLTANSAEAMEVGPITVSSGNSVSFFINNDAGDINFNGDIILNSADNFITSSGTNVNFTGTGSRQIQLTSSQPSSVYFYADNTITISPAMSIDVQGDITFDASTVNANGALNITANRDVYLTGAFSSNVRGIQVTAETGSIYGGSASISSNYTSPGNFGNISLTAPGGSISIGNLTSVTNQNVSHIVDIFADGSIDVGTINTNGSGRDGDVYLDMNQSNFVVTDITAGGGSVEITNAGASLQVGPNLNGGTVILNADTSIDFSAAPGVFNQLSLMADSVNLNNFVTLSASPDASGRGGTIDIVADSLTANSTIFLNAFSPSGPGGYIYLQLGNANQSIDANASGTDAGGAIEIHSFGNNPLSISNLKADAADISGSTIGGLITVTTDAAPVEVNGSISARALSGTGSGGFISVLAAGSLSFLNAAQIFADGGSSGTSSGGITLNANNILFAATSGINDLQASGGPSTSSDISIVTTGGGVVSNGSSISMQASGDVTLTISDSTVSTAGFGANAGDFAVNAFGSVVISSDVNTSGLAGGDVSVIAAGPLSVGSIIADAQNSGMNGGNVTLLSGAGAIVVSNIGTSGASGGAVAVTTLLNASTQIESIVTTGSTGSGGSITILNLGPGVAGDFILGSTFFANSTGASGGTIYIRNESGGIVLPNGASVSSGGVTRGDIDIGSVGSIVSNSGLSVLGKNIGLAAPSISVDSSSGVSVEATGYIDVNGPISTSRSTAGANSGPVTLISNGGFVAVQSITTSAALTGNSGNVYIQSGAGQDITVTGNISGFNSGTGNFGDVTLISADSLSVTGIINGGALSVSAHQGLDLRTSVKSLIVSAAGQPVTIHQSNDPMDILVLDATSVLIDSIGDLRVAANISGVDSIELIARDGADISVDNQLQVNTNGLILLRTVNGGNINQSAAGAITVNGTGQLEIVLDGATFGTATLTEANDVDRLSTGGGGTVNFNNGANSFELLGVGNGQDFTASVTAGVLISVNDIDNSNGTITLLTPNLQITRDVTAGSITVQNPNGTLTVTGVAGASLNGLVPTAGTPGSPSNPTSILLAAPNGGDVELNGDLALTGDATFRAVGGSIRSNVNSLFAGTNNIVLDADQWVQSGNGNITANNLILPVKATIINTGGNVNINSDITILGHDLAIMASGNINIAGGVDINISNTTLNAGNLTIIAGWSFVENSGGQQETDDPYTLNNTSANTGSVNAAGVNIVTTATSGDGGNVFIGAKGGSVTIGNITTTSTSGTDGSILIAGGTGVTAGDLIVGDGNVALIATDASLIPSGVVTVNNGTLLNGEFASSSTGSGRVTVGDIVGGAGSILLQSTDDNLISVTGTVFTANQIVVRAGTGDIKFTNLNAITATASASGDGGLIDLAGNALSATSPTLALTANGTTSGGTVIIDLIQAVTVGTGGNLTISATGTTAAGSAEVASDGNLIVNSGGFNLSSTAGNGASVRLESLAAVTLNDVGFLDVDATGVNGNGGRVEIAGVQGITTTGTVGDPTVVSANGVGTGAGGVIIIDSGTVTPMYIGTPSKAPKGAALFLELAASAGATGASAGVIDITSGGPITADSAAMVALPGANNSNGGSIRLDSASALIVSGDINVRGTGTGTAGLVRLSSNNKKAFSIGTGKVPKNGVQGNIFGRTLQVVNSGGGLLIGQNLSADTVSLQAGLKGTIAAAKGISIEATTLNLLSDTGAIGKKPLEIEANIVEVTSLGAVNLLSTSTSLNILSSTAGKGGFNLNHAGSLTIQGIAVTGGDIEITTGGTINSTLGSNISASDGAITLVNSDTAGTIVISSGSTIETLGSKGGAVIIAIGEAPKKGVNRLADNPPALDVQEVGKKGLAYYDGVSGGLVVNGTNNVVFAENKPVILSNPNTGSGTIILGGNTTIHADPPVGVKEVSARGAFAGSLEIPQAITLSSSVIETSAPTIVEQVGAWNGIAFDTMRASQNFATLDASAQTSLSGANQKSSLQAFGANGFVDGVGTVEIVGNQRNRQQDELFIDAKLVADEQKHHVQKNGNFVYAPSTDITVATKHGTVKIAANAVAVVMQTNEGLSVYDIDDHSKNAVVIETHGKQVSLTPGLHATISDHASEQFEDVNAIELVQHRGLNHAKLNNGWKLYTSEFSIPSACFAVKPLREIAASNHKSSAKLKTRMMKTAAVIMNLRPDRGDYVQFFKSQRTAMTK